MMIARTPPEGCVPRRMNRLAQLRAAGKNNGDFHRSFTDFIELPCQ